MAREVWIIGASQGLGLSVAEQYAGRGHRVVGMSRSMQPVDGLFDAWLQVDVTDAAAFDATIESFTPAAERPA